MNTIKKIYLLISFLYGSLFSQNISIGIQSTLNTVLTEDFLNLAQSWPEKTEYNIAGFEVRIAPLPEIHIYTGINFQYGKKDAFSWVEGFNLTVDNIEFSYINTKRNISVYLIKIPVIYSIQINQSVNFNFGLYFGWNEFILNNKGDLILDTGEKYTEATDKVRKTKYFTEPTIELDVQLISCLNFLFNASYKNLEYEITSQRKVENLTLRFYTEKYKYYFSKIYFTVGLNYKI